MLLLLLLQLLLLLLLLLLLRAWVAIGGVAAGDFGRPRHAWC